MSSYMILNVIVQYLCGECVMDVYLYLFVECVIYFGIGIDVGVVNVLIVQLLYFDVDSLEFGVQFYINSEGGDFGVVLVIYDMMQYICFVVVMICVGQVIGFVVLLVVVGVLGECVVFVYVCIVLYQLVGQLCGVIFDFILVVDEVVWVCFDMEEIFVRYSGCMVVEFCVDIDCDWVFIVFVVFDYGLIDIVLGFCI